MVRTLPDLGTVPGGGALGQALLRDPAMAVGTRWGALGAVGGGTGLDTSGASGVPSVNAGAWIVNNVLTPNRILYAAAGNTVASSANLTFNGTSLVVGTAGPHAIGAPTDTGTQLQLGGSFGPGPAYTVGFGMFSALSVAVNRSAVVLDVEPVIVEAASGTHPILAGIYVLPVVTPGAATTTTLAGVYIDGITAASGTATAAGLFVTAPTGATNNYAIYASGGTRIDTRGLGLNAAPPTPAGTIAATLGTNGATGLLMKRATDSLPVGAFLDLQSAAGASLCAVGIDGSITTSVTSAVHVLNSNNVTIGRASNPYTDPALVLSFLMVGQDIGGSTYNITGTAGGNVLIGTVFAPRMRSVGDGDFVAGVYAYAVAQSDGTNRNVGTLASLYVDRPYLAAGETHITATDVYTGYFVAPTFGTNRYALYAEGITSLGTLGVRGTLTADVDVVTKTGFKVKVGATDYAITTVTLKTGSGAGNYTTSSASYVDVDATNLAFTVTVPTGFKITIVAIGNVSVSGAGNTVNLALADGTTALTEAQAGSASGAEIFSLAYAFTGDGASHTFKLRWNTTGGTATMLNATQKPQMVFLMVPSA